MENYKNINGLNIYTSRYGNKNLINHNSIKVGISIGKPKFNTVYEVKERILELAPEYDWLKLPYDIYKKKYIDKLERIGVDMIIDILLYISQKYENKEITLLCFEDIRKEGQWCHRTIFSEWFKEKTGININELESKETLSVKQNSILNYL